jgi:predicted transposase/invertase (TIGR01784 family)
MKHPIDPKVDCVFKALLGAEENRNLLIHFINAMLGDALELPVYDVEIVNPYNEKEYLNDKLSIVDVKAKDKSGNLYQIEIQLLNRASLKQRMIYTWADLYSQQLSSGQNYGELKQTYSIWLIAHDIIEQDDLYLRNYQLREENGQILVPHGGIWLIELQKFVAQDVQTETDRWLKFFQEGEWVDETNLPAWMTTIEMEQAMETLKRFSEKEINYFAYQSRMAFLREQNEIEENIKRIAGEKARLEQEKSRLEQETSRLEQETSRLEQETSRLEQEKSRLEQETSQLEQAKAQAEQAKALTELELKEALAEIARLKSLGNA